MESHSGNLHDDFANLTNNEIFRVLIKEKIIDLNPGPILDDAPPQIGRIDFDKIEGMMLGLAIGDSLGKGSESMRPLDRMKYYGMIRDYLPHPAASGQAKGLPSDDTQLAFWTLESMLEHNGFSPKALADLYTSGRRIYGLGSAVRSFIRNYKDYNKPWYLAGARSAGNGALMRIAPILIPHVTKPSSDLWVDTVLCAMITHNDSCSISSCVSFINILWQLLSMSEAPDPMWWPDEFTKTASQLECNEDYKPRGGDFMHYKGPVWRFVDSYLMETYRSDKSTLDACNSWYSGAFLLETVPSVIYILMKHGSDFESALIRAVNDTRDNDTVAAIVGAAMGALHGKKAIPKHWIENLLGRTTDSDDGQIFALLEKAKERWW